MGGKYQAYLEYKDSGVGWMGNVPKEWSVLPCRAVVTNIANKNEGAKDKNYLSLMANIGVIRYEDKGAVGNKKPEDLSKCKIVKKGNLVINSMNYAIGSYGMSGYDGVCSPVYIVLDANAEAIKQRFALRIFENRPFQKHLATFGNGILEHRAAIGWDDIKGACIPLPSNDEQIAILKFLDHETAKIDTLIEKQQQLIKLLKEKRQAVISHAVTKGLNPNAPMRDSGVEWLGEVPEHWGVLSLGKVTLSKCDGPFGSGLKSAHYTKSGVRVIRLQNIKMGKYINGEGAFISEDYYKNNLRNHDVSAGDVLIAGLGDPRNPVGRACIAPAGISPAMVKADCFRFRLDEAKVCPEFIAEQLSVSSFHDAGKLSNGSTRARIPLNLMTTRTIAICPKQEQLKILAHIKQLSSRYDQLEMAAMLAIELMQERRTALISAVVTGKIDVRNWVAPEPSKNNTKEVAA
jgi:type I restriction enzyme S subunit